MGVHAVGWHVHVLVVGVQLVNLPTISETLRTAADNKFFYKIADVAQVRLLLCYAGLTAVLLLRGCSADASRICCVGALRMRRACRLQAGVGSTVCHCRTLVPAS